MSRLDISEAYLAQINDTTRAPPDHPKVTKSEPFFLKKPKDRLMFAKTVVELMMHDLAYFEENKKAAKDLLRKGS